MALQEVLNSSIWVIKDDKSNYQPLYGQFLYTLNTNASGDDDNGVLYVGNGTEWINVMGTALQGVIENILATVPFEQIDNKTIFDAINEKANKATTLEGYGIEDAYTKTTIDAIILALEAELAGKQDKLTAGANIAINGNKISATDTKYTAGSNIAISDANEISVTGVYTSEQVDEKLSTKADTSSLDGKQDKLKAGTNIAISDTNEISVTGLTKDSVGLGNVDNTSDADKPVSSATQEALTLKADKSQVANISTDGNTTKIEGNLEVAEVDTGEGGSIMTGTLVAHGQVDVDSISVGMSSPLDSVATKISSDSKDTEIPTAKATYTFVKLVSNTIEGYLANKQDKLTAGDNISIDNNTVSVTGVYTSEQVDEKLATKADATSLDNKQDKLTAGTNITISDTNEISVTDLTKASVGLGNVDNTSDANKPVSTATQEALDKKQNKLTAGDGIVIDETTNTISATGTGSGTVKSVNSVEPDDNGNVAITTANIPNLGISEDGKTITIGDKSIEPLTSDSTIAANKIEGVVAEATKATQDGNGNVISTTYAKVTDLANKQNKLTAGNNITINETTNTISATDTTYTAGTNVSISDANVISATDTTYTAGTNIAISAANEISVTGLTKASVGLDKVDNTSDADKPISTATQTALDLKADKTQVANISTNETVTTVSGSLHVEELDTGETGSISTGTLVAHGQVDVPSITVGASGVINSIATSVSANSTDTEIPTAKATYTFTKNAVSSLETIVSGKQDKLTAGDNITINNNTISATDTKYTAGTGINISDDNVITATGGVAGTVTSVNNITPDDGGNVSLGVANIPGAYSETQATTDLATKQDKLSAGANIAISATNVISATDTIYTAGSNISIGDDNAISVTGVYTSSQVDEKLATKADASSLDDKQDKLVAGSNITINEATNTISATDTKYTAGTNITISDANAISVTGLYTNTQIDGFLADKADSSVVEDLATTVSGKADKATTLEGYGITDAKIADGTITLGKNSITPLTAASEIPADKVTGLTKASVGLDNVDNTSDAEKPISDATQAALDNKQDTLTAGANITILGSTISSKDTTYTAGANITISDTNEISATDTKYTAGSNIAISEANAISVTGLYTASQVDGLLSGKADVSSLDDKQDKLTAGANIEIDTATNTISVTGVVPSAQAAGFADKAAADGYGNNIAETYATIGDVQSKQDFNLVTTIDSTSDDTHYPSAKAVYDYAQASVTSTVEITVTPTVAQTATAITDALAKKARVIVIPSLANTGAIYIKESDTYSSVNPIYPDPTNNVYEFTNMQNVKVFVDSVGDSVDLVIEYRG